MQQLLHVVDSCTNQPYLHQTYRTVHVVTANRSRQRHSRHKYKLCACHMAPLAVTIYTVSQKRSRL